MDTQNQPQHQNQPDDTQHLAPPESGEATITFEDEMEMYRQEFRAWYDDMSNKQNINMALLAGLVVSLICAIAWAAITVSTGYQIGYMAIGVGFVVGWAMRKTGNGLEMKFGIAGAIMALFACLIGNYFGIIGFTANYLGTGNFEVLTSIPISAIPEVLVETFDPMDIVFYGIAIFFGYKYSFYNVTEESYVNGRLEETRSNS